MNAQEIAEKVEEGYLHVLTVFEVAGKPKEHVEESLAKYISQLRDEKAVTVLNEDTHEAVELADEEGFFSAFSELEVLLPQLESLTSMAFNYTPASVEVLAPDSVRVSARELQNWLNDLLSQLHTISQALRAERQKSAYLSKNLMNLLQNMITVLLASGPKPTAELARLTGTPEESVAKVLARMDEQGIIVEEEGAWTISRNK